jgi:ketosteroid isomerase-like protein
VEQLIPTAGAEVRKLESERLFALIDGLALHAAIHAEASPPELMRAVLDRHLDELSRTKIDQDDDAVSTFVHRWAEAIASNDVDAIEPFTTEDWVLIDGPGAIPRAKFHQVVADGTLRHDRMTHDVLDITPHGDVVVVRTRGRTSGSFQGAPIDADEWTTNVLVKESDGWRCALTQLTPVAIEV